MASAGKRSGAGERVLAGRHVIGLFCLMLVFSGVFFTLGYVMGRNQNDGQVRASTDLIPALSNALHGKSDSSPKHPDVKEIPPSDTDASNPPAPDWEFYHAGETAKTDDQLKPAAPAPKTLVASAKSPAAAKPATAAVKTSSSAPLIPGGAYVLQVAALNKEADAMALAANLQKKKFPAFVLSPATDKFYRVQVGPFADLKAANAAKKGLDTAGFKAIVKH